MIITVVELVVGVVLAFAFLLWTRAQPDAGRRPYAIGLGVTALIYVMFPVIGGAGARSLGLEALGLLLYGAAAWIGFRKSTTLLALGWAMHPFGTSRSISRAPAQRTRRTGTPGAASASIW